MEDEKLLLNKILVLKLGIISIILENNKEIPSPDGTHHHHFYAKQSLSNVEINAFDIDILD